MKNLPNGYFMISDWMTDKLKLKGNTLLIFALIYSYSGLQNIENETDKRGYYYGTQEYLGAWFNISKPTVITCLKDLIDRNFIIKKFNASAGFINRYTYSINEEKLKELKCIN